MLAKQIFFLNFGVKVTGLGMLVCLSSCANWKESELKELKEKNVVQEPIVRKQGDVCIRIEKPLHRTRDAYPWEKEKR